ncbi:MAG: putative glycoside hydrolase [Erysipelotrichaceae bacterium]|uniref:putative glycoside hydrolase n=1 Tax=Floccifex sp. TaxID=2815810 RepID=UPI002A757573|nr:putative glycoside hydrolase [Floccifex sp.]MDD7280988.1 putative glycoside hydrolase [Erysipelotrichaceae bacterium]MDY2958938.1 putative glycoside hydrolase [Floccifex sp.]
MRKKNIMWGRFTLVAILTCCIVLLGILGCFRLSEFLHPTKYIKIDENTINIKIPYKENGEIVENVLTLPRGTSVEVRESSANSNSSMIRYQGKEFSIDNKYLADSLDECVKTDYVYPRRLVNLYSSKNGKLSNAIVEKGEQVKVVDVSGQDLNLDTGVVNWYKVEKNDKTYWLNGHYVETNKAALEKSYSSSIVYSTYWDQFYGDKYSKNAYIDQVDYKPFAKISYEDNPIRTDLNCLHVSLNNLVNYKDYFLNLNKTTSINSYCVELKGDEGYLWYKSDVPDQYMSKNNSVCDNAIVSKNELSKLFKEFQDEGYYMIGRIVAFKDNLFAMNNKSAALTDKKGNLLLHNNSYWPSAYSRETWMYIVDIAKEVAQCNVNEIQFDYVRFPDGMLQSTLDEAIDFKNKYNESKVSALQGFLMYAKLSLMDQQVYVGADIFAWPVVAEDDQDIGQFLPAMASVVDVISPMPYLDHFSQGSMGIEEPTLEPMETLYKFSSIAMRQLDKIESSCVYRTWIQGYSCSTNDIQEQIKGINKAGYEGYMVWYGNGNPNDYQKLEEGFIDSAIEKEES